MTSDSTDFVFGWSTKDIDEAYKIFNKAIEIASIEILTDIDRKVEEYKNWLFSLCESEYQILRQEGFIEWRHGRKGIVRQYAQKHNLIDEYDFATQESWDKVFTKTDCRRFLNILLNIDYPSFPEWELISDFQNQFLSEVKAYIYNFFVRYSENFAQNLSDIQTKKIQCGLAFGILNHIETDEKILEILSEYDKDQDKYYHSQEQRILESYINPIIKRINKNTCRYHEN